MGNKIAKTGRIARCSTNGDCFGAAEPLLAGSTLLGSGTSTHCNILSRSHQTPLSNRLTYRRDMISQEPTVRIPPFVSLNEMASWILTEGRNSTEDWTQSIIGAGRSLARGNTTKVRHGGPQPGSSPSRVGGGACGVMADTGSHGVPSLIGIDTQHMIAPSRQSNVLVCWYHLASCPLGITSCFDPMTSHGISEYGPNCGHFILVAIAQCVEVPEPSNVDPARR
ncbi:16785_t:CDS:2, partial [Acaulospora colombiana]